LNLVIRHGVLSRWSLLKKIIESKWLSTTVKRSTVSRNLMRTSCQDVVQNVAQYNVYSTLDLKSAYHQLELPAEDRLYTAFQADGGLWQWKRIPFGLTKAVPCFQRVMDDLIKNHGCQGTFAIWIILLLEERRKRSMTAIWKGF